MDEIHEITGMKLAELRDVTTERKQRRRLAVMVARVPGTDSTSDKVMKAKQRVIADWQC